MVYKANISLHKAYKANICLRVLMYKKNRANAVALFNLNYNVSSAKTGAVTLLALTNESESLASLINV